MTNLDKGLKLIEKINNLGYKAYIVGGAVRDHILGYDPIDIDITTSMPIDEIKNNFKTSNSKNPYLSIKVEYLDLLFEVTEFRTDIEYKDHRHPSVKLVDSLEEDLKRRDFSINSIALDKDKNIIDKYNGINDINNKIIRITGDKDKRFKEDSLRILRALYFSSKLGFDIEIDTLNSMINNKNLLKDLSNERLFEYYKKILYEPYNNGLIILNKYDIFSDISDYKYFINISDKALTVEENMLLFYVKTKNMPPFTYKSILVDIKNIESLYQNNFNNYYLYKNKYLLDKYKNLFIYLDLYDNLIFKIINMPISNDTELKVSKKEISNYFKGKDISIKIEEVLYLILNNKLKNERSEILTYLGVDTLEPHTR